MTTEENRTVNAFAAASMQSLIVAAGASVLGGSSTAHEIRVGIADTAWEMAYLMLEAKPKQDD